MSFSSRSLLLCALVALCAACASPRELGDHALEQKQYDEALRYYDQEIEQGSRDPELFYNAAQAALNTGDLGAAERFYSRSLRHGGGIKVMRSLAAFYIQTSNYARAAEVLYELLRIDPDQQMIYNNLGTALLYGGHYIEAESLLLIAQQLDPVDPLPYLNLGIIYDRHMYDGRRGASFYICYLQLSQQDSPQRNEVVSRINELREQFVTPLSEITCGQAYIPGEQRDLDPDERRARLEELKRRARQEDLATPNTSQRAPSEPTPVSIDDAADGSSEAPIVSKAIEAEAMKLAYREGRCEAVITARHDAPIELLTPAQSRMLADCHRRLSAPEEAKVLLEHVLQTEPTSGDLLSLLELLKQEPDHASAITTLCRTHADLITLDAIRSYCTPALPQK